ncbi:MAG: Mov34/MPN/PAD-1 family protein [Planctomycetes bacterium]|nr:Mov34/MPN/PAD-1 family protein [Planctomycetota bacterium]
MSRPRFSYYLEHATGRVPIDESKLDVALEAAQFEEVRRGRRVLTTNPPPELRVVPQWHRVDGRPRVEALAVHASDREAPIVVCSVRSIIVRPESTRGIPVDVHSGERSEVGEVRVLAFESPTAALPEDRAPFEEEFQFEEIAEPIPVIALGLDSLALERQEAPRRNDDRFPVFVPRRVLDEIVDLKRRAGSVETGGLLIGHLARDPREGTIFAVVAAQIPARHAVAEPMRLSFTEATWTAARAAMTLRGRGEIVLGWHHTHPARVWCRDCPRERWPECPLAQDFFSAADEDVHRAVTPKAFGFALVCGDRVTTAGDWTDSHAMFGWRDGEIVRRPFMVLEAEPVLPATTSSPVLPPNEGEDA